MRWVPVCVRRPRALRPGSAWQVTWLALWVLFATVRPGTSVASSRPPVSHVVLVSIDGLYPDIYRRPRELGLRVPNLQRLVRAGTSADGMVGIFPSSTYPSHTTLVSGVRSARHGIVANTVFDPASREASWYWYADSLKVTVLPQAAHAAGLVVGVSNWPALVGASWVDWQLPEIWSLGPWDASSRQKTLQWATPGLVTAVEKRFGAWTDARFEWGAQDDRITDGAVYLIEAKRPHLLLVHLVEVDHVLHAEGRNAPAALRAFEMADRQLGRILDAIDHAGLRDSTNVVIVGDHGFADVHSEFRPNVVLAAAGLLGDGAGEWRARARTNTAAAAVYLRDPSDADTAARARAALEELAHGRDAGVFEILDRETLDAYGAFPGAAFGLACRLGYTFGGSTSGAPLVAARSRSMHGYRPELVEMQAGFIACGPRFAVGLTVPLMRMIDVAPTLATVLGVDLGPQVEGIAVPGLLRSVETDARRDRPGD